MSQLPPIEPEQPTQIVVTPVYPTAQMPTGYSPPGYAPLGYSPPANFWPHYLTPPDALLGPARRASIMLFVLGGLMLLAGGCIGLTALGSSEEMISKAIDEMRNMNPQQGDMITPKLLRGVYIAMAVGIVLAAFVSIALAVFVRSGSRASSITALVLTALPILFIVLVLLSSLVSGPTAFVSTVLVMIFPLVLFAMTITFLINAIRAAPQVDAARQQLMMAHHQHQAHYYAYAQQQQMPPQS